MDPNLASAMREMSRGAFQDIWQRGRKGEHLTTEDEAIYAAMQLHPEYTDIWSNAGQLGQREVLVDGVNPFLHVAMHSVIERQIQDQNPPETSQAMFRLTRAGMDRHEAMHRVLEVFTELLWDTIREKKPFDQSKYHRRLRAIKP
jgi:hypothetical protein